MSGLGAGLGLLALAGNLIVVLKGRASTGVALYVVLAMVAPTVTIVGLPIAYELYALPPILGLALIRRPRLRHLRLHVALGSYLALLLLSTIVSAGSYGLDVDLVRLQGVVRFLVLLSLAAEFLDRADIEKVLLTVVGVNAVAALVQLLVPGTAGFFLEMYGRVGQTVLQRYALEDVIPRASGTFNSPVELGAVALLGVAVGWAGMISRRPLRRHRWLLFLGGMAGILSLSKTFILGAPVVLVGGLLLGPLTKGTHPLRMRPRTATLMTAAVVATVGAVALTASYLQQVGFGVEYYVRYLLDPQAAFATRYGPGGQLEETIAVVRAHPLIGVGVTKLRGEFTGDSFYVWLLHSTGAVGATLVTAGLLLLLHRIVIAQYRPALLVVGAVLMMGTAFPIFPSLPGALALAYILAATASAAPAPSGERLRSREVRLRGMVESRR